jgi:hypothetical protein
MAQVPYPHVEAPRVIRIDGVVAFQPGDPVPVDTARRLGLLDTEDAPPILAGTGVAFSLQFSDAELKVAAEAAAAGANLSDDTTPPEPTPPQGDATTATPSPAPAAAPTKGRAAPSTPAS